MGVAVLQYSLIYENRQLAGFDPWTLVCQLLKKVAFKLEMVQ